MGASGAWAVVCAGVLVGCGGASGAKSTAKVAPAPQSAAVDAEARVEAGDVLAAMTPHDGTFDPPVDWVPAMRGIFPPAARHVAETWNFSIEVHCRTAWYVHGLEALHAENPKWAELAGVLQQDPERFQVNRTFDGIEVQLMRTAGWDKQPALSVCTKTHAPNRVAIASAVMRRHPALKGHDVLLREGFVTMADYDREVSSEDAQKIETRVNVWVRGDEAARSAWLAWLRKGGFVQDDAFHSTTAGRTYSVTQKGAEYELQIAAEQ